MTLATPALSDADGTQQCKGADDKRSCFLAMTAVGVAAVLRLVALGQKTLWCDELAVVQRLGLSFREHVAALRGNHPLYELLLRLWAGPESSDVWLRIPSAVLGVVAVWLTWLLLKAWDRRIAWIGTWLMALSPLHLMYSRIGRAYSLAATLALLSNLLLLRTLRHRRAGPLIGYVLATTLMVYANLAAASLCIAHGIYLLWFHRRHLRRIRRWVVSGVCICLLLLPWMWFSFVSAVQWSDETQYTAQQQGRGLKTAYQAFTLSVGETVNPLNWPVVIPAALGFAGAMALGMLWTLRDRSRMGAFLATQVVVIYVFGIAFGAAAAKHLAVILPAWLGIVAAGIVRARSRWLAVGLGCLVFATMAVSDLNYFTGRQFADADMVTPWREIAARVASQATPGDAILVGYRMDAGVRDAFARYYEGPGEPTWLGRDEWQPVLASALREHETVFLLLHDGDPWRDIEAWFETLPPGLLFARETFQDEEHTLDRLRAGEVFGDATKFRSPLYRLYRITKTGERSH